MPQEPSVARAHPASATAKYHDQQIQYTAVEFRRKGEEYPCARPFGCGSIQIVYETGLVQGRRPTDF